MLNKILAFILGPSSNRKTVNSKGESKEQISEIKLESGGQVTLSIDVDLFGLSKSDSDFVLKLVDAVKEYNNKKEK